jgi:hypothetical protein
MCASLQIQDYGNPSKPAKPSVSVQHCGDMREFFKLGTDSGYVPVVFTPSGAFWGETTITVAQVPTVNGLPLKVMKFETTNGQIVAIPASTVTVLAQDSMIQNTFPAFQQLSSFGRATLMSVRNFLPSHPVATTDGLLVRVKQRMAQNTLNTFDFDATVRSMKYFMTGDPGLYF